MAKKATKKEKKEKTSTNEVSEIFDKYKPDIIIHLAMSKTLPANLFDDFSMALLEKNIFVFRYIKANRAKKNISDTLLIASFLLVSKEDSFHKKDITKRRNLLKKGMKTLAEMMHVIDKKMSKTIKIKPESNISETFSLSTLIGSGKHLNFLFRRNAPLKDWEMCVDAAVNFMIEGYEKKDSELRRMFKTMERPVKFPLHLLFNKRKKKWEPYIHQRLS